MNKKPQVSVILPVYNGAQFVGEAIQSIATQTFQDWELIAIDDGSRDNSWAVLQNWQKRDSRIRLAQNPRNMGLAATMNRLVALAEGQYIAVQEQDDVSAADRLESEVALLNARADIALVSGVAEWLNEDLQPFDHFPGFLYRGGQYPQDSEELFEFLYVEQCKILNAGCLFRRDILATWNPLFNEQARMSIDWEFFLRLSRFAKVWGLNQVVVKMRRGFIHGSLSSQRQLQYAEARRCLNALRREFRSGPTPRVTFQLWRKAMAMELAIEARAVAGQVVGIRLLAMALAYDPANQLAWQTVREWSLKATKRLLPATHLGVPAQAEKS